MAETMFSTPQAPGSVDRSCCGSRQSSPRPFNDDSAIDKILAAEMNELTMKERMRVLEDIHGVSKPPDETPEELEAWLTGLDDSIARLPRRTRTAFERATFLRPEIQSDVKFKLRFLRADSFNVENAARRITNYFSHKLRLFGDDKLVKKLALEDLQERDIQILKTGCFMVVPSTDPMGRTIVFIDFSIYDLSDQDSMMRAIWYFTSSSFNDEITQRNGVCHIAYCPGRLLNLPVFLSSFAEHFRRAGAAASALPFRFSSTHFCYDDPGLWLMLSGIHMNFSRDVRLRMRSHYGSRVEHQYSLMSFGISGLDPFFGDGADRQEYIDNFYRRRWEEDENDREQMIQHEAESGIIVYPTPGVDVLIGRGHPYHDFSGTRRLLTLIESELGRYSQDSDQFSKTCLAMEIVKRVHEWNGRFLHRNDKGWEVIDDVAARRKVINLFRYKKNLQESMSSSNKSKRARRS